MPPLTAPTAGCAPLGGGMRTRVALRANTPSRAEWMHVGWPTAFTPPCRATLAQLEAFVIRCESEFLLCPAARAARWTPLRASTHQGMPWRRHHAVARTERAGPTEPCGTAQHPPPARPGQVRYPL